MRSLGPDELALWDRVTATIRPLSREPMETGPTAVRGDPPRPKPVTASSQPPARNNSGKSATSSATLNSHWDRRLRSGSVAPDRVLDLHGHSLEEAWRAIDCGLDRAIGNDERIVLLITGHARPGDVPVKRGKIRAAVNDWLAASRHSRRIAAVRGAHVRHGGGGSLYIILRRKGPRSTIS